MFEIIEVIARPRVTGQLLNVLDVILLFCSVLIMCRTIKHCKDAEECSDKEEKQIIKRRLQTMFFGCFCIAVASMLSAVYGSAIKPEIIYGTALMNTACCILTAREVCRLKNTGSAREEHKK